MAARSRSVLAPARFVGHTVLRTQSDERLVDLAKHGSEPAFEAIVVRYRRALLRYCRWLLGEESAEDAAQETLIKAYAAIRHGEVVGRLRPWLFRIAHNTALNLVRDRARGETVAASVPAAEGPDRVAERQQELREVLSAVQGLPARQRDAIVLRELEGRSYEEIAGQLGVSGGAVRQLLNRARTSIRSGLSVVTPIGLLLRLPLPGESAPAALRIAELSTPGSTGAAAAKVCAAAVLGGTVGGVVSELPGGSLHRVTRSPAHAQSATPRPPSTAQPRRRARQSGLALRGTVRPVGFRPHVTRRRLVPEVRVSAPASRAYDTSSTVRSAAIAGAPRPPPSGRPATLDSSSRGAAGPAAADRCARAPPRTA